MRLGSEGGGGAGTTEGSLRVRPAKDSALIYPPPQGANGRRENVGQPRTAVFHRREENGGAEAAAAERRRLQRLAVVSLHRAEGSCSNTAYINRKTDLNTISTPPTSSYVSARCTKQAGIVTVTESVCGAVCLSAPCVRRCVQIRDDVTITIKSLEPDALTLQLTHGHAHTLTRPHTYR